jgi:hypothetical protein
MDEYVVYRTVLDDLDWVKAKSWDLWCDRDPNRMMREVSRGHTLTEAMNLTKLANEQQEKEDEI